MSILTARGEVWYPAGAVGVTVTKSATPWTNGSNATAFTSDATSVLVGIVVDNYDGLSRDAELDVMKNGEFYCMFPFSTPGAETAYHHWEYKLPIPIGLIDPGDVIAVRARGSSTTADTFSVRVGVIANFDGDYTEFGTLTQRCYPTGSEGVPITPNATPWQWSAAWAELIAHIPDGSLIVGVAYRVPGAGSTVTNPTTIEMQLAEDA